MTGVGAIETRVLELAAAIVGRPPSSLDPEGRWSELGLDSLDLLALITDCESELDCTLPDERLPLMRTPRSLARQVEASTLRTAATA